MSTAAALLPFQRNLLTKLTSPDDPNVLLLLARGLGLRLLVNQLLKVFDEPENLVVVLNASEEEESALESELGLKVRLLRADTSSKERQSSYERGGIVSVTSRIMVVDMLNKVIPVEQVTGLVLLHAEKVTPTSTEAFIVRIFRDKNRDGFVKAFSDQPESFLHSGFSPLATVMTQLKMRSVLIWPRFHEEVNKDLNAVKSDVVELHQPLSDSMKVMQQAIIDCMDATLSEIKRSHTVIESDDLTVDNALFKSFDSLVRSQLDPHWHKIGPKTRQLVSDMATLRQLLVLLLATDCVGFNQYLETVVSSSGGSTNASGATKAHLSPWLYLPAADQLMQAARKRVYLKDSEVPKVAPPTEEQQQQQENQASNAPIEASHDDDEAAYWKEFEPTAEEEAEAIAMMDAFDDGPAASTFPTNPLPSLPKPKPWWDDLHIKPVLEEQPKWELLSEVLDEVEQDLHLHPSQPGDMASDTVLIMCDSNATCSTLRRYLSEAPKFSTDDLFTIEMPEQQDDVSDSLQSGSRSGRRMLEQRLKSYFWWKASMGKMSRNLLHAATSKTAGSQGGSKESVEESAAFKRKREWRNNNKAPSYKRRRVRGGGNAGGPGSRAEEDKRGAEAMEQEASRLAKALQDPGEREGVEELDPEMDDTLLEEFFGLIPTEELLVVRSYAGDDDDRALEELRPKYVIMYDADPAFIRRIEAYKAAHRGHAMRIYFLMYGSSVEEPKYLISIRKEKEAFERIIRERATMALTLEAEKRPGEREDSELLRTVSSRVAGGGRLATVEPPRVIVDVREFRSSLPSLLHASSFQVVPMTLTIGDYVLSPDMCVERKSIPDLISSFNSGRLYQQAELMSIYYKSPILLIEFDQKKSFSLETYVDNKAKAFSSSSSDTDLHAKLVLLTLTFPRLRIIWSQSPYGTSDIFAELKQNNPEPDPDRAVALGAEDAESQEDYREGYETSFNPVPQDMLRSMPGVNSKNFRYLMRHVTNVQELAEMGRGEIGELIGDENARALSGFIEEDSLKGGS